jgi:hypothetical protein
MSAAVLTWYCHKKLGNVWNGEERTAKIMGVQWLGEHDAVGDDEKEDFERELTRLGYNPARFRATVRRRLPANPGAIYPLFHNIMVEELSANEQPFRGATFVGGHGEVWVARFVDLSSEAFPMP